MIPTFNMMLNSPPLVVKGSPLPLNSPTLIKREKSEENVVEKPFAIPVERDSFEVPRKLCERILQKVVATFYSSAHLLVLLILQGQPVALSLEDIWSQTPLPRDIIRGTLSDLVVDNIISQYAMVGESQKTQKKTKKIGNGYYIDYKTAIEAIVYRITKFGQKMNDRTSTMSSFHYECSCNASVKYSYESVLEYQYENSFICPNCYKELELVKDTETTEISTDFEKKWSLIKDIKVDLEKLRMEYSDVRDYPRVNKVNDPQSIITEGQGMSRRERKPTKRERNVTYSNELMPWEDEYETMQKTTEEKKTMEDEYSVDTIDFGSFIFLQPNKTFVDVVNIIPSSPERQSQHSVLVVKNEGKNRRKEKKRVVMASMM